MTPVDIDACRKLCEPSTNIDLASHEHFLMLQRNLRRALNEIAELRAEVERLRVERDCALQDANHLTNERDEWMRRAKAHGCDLDRGDIDCG